MGDAVSCAITVALDHDEVAAGAPVAGEVRVTEGGRARRLWVVLQCRDATADYDGFSRQVTGPDLATGDLQTGATYRFELTLPSDALPAITGAYGRTWWEVVARVDRFGSDADARAEIRLAPASGT